MLLPPEVAVVEEHTEQQDVDHVTCLACFEKGHDKTICGVPMDGLRILPEHTPLIGNATPCPVCFYSSEITCNNCGRVVDVAGAI